MEAFSLLLSLVIAAAAAAATHSARLSAETLQQYYHYTPAGYVLRSCVRTVPSGTHMQQTAEGLTALFPNGTAMLVPPCRRPHVSLPVVLRSLPPDYDGWLAYTAYNNNTGFDAFLGSFSVPNVPRRLAHILYLFTGLQNIDWIPLVDPESEGANFDIIQPVLQYPGDAGSYWSVKSWYVTLTEGATASEELPVQPGDVIFGNMTRTGPTSWFIGAERSGSGKSSNLQATHSRLRTQAWAYNVLEAYGVSGCQNYPDNSVEFTGLSLISGGSRLAPEQVGWKLNPKPDPKHFCHEAMKVVDGAHMSVTFQ